MTKTLIQEQLQNLRFAAEHLHRAGAALINIAGGVARFLWRSLTHENVNPEKRQSTLSREFHGLLVGLNILVSGVLDRDILKTRSF